MSTLKEKSQLIGFCGCALIIIGCFLPFMSAGEGATYMSVSYVVAGGFLILILPIISAILIAFKKRFWVYIPTIISAGFFLNDTISMFNGFNAKVQLQVGGYLIYFGLMLILIYPFLAKKSEK